MKNEEQPHALNICGAKTRTGKPCQSKPVTNKKRCRMHGGAKGSGAPTGNQNALKHGLYTKENTLNRNFIKEKLNY